ncbi:hypothetical protein LPB67_08090 [Undibacterium sp. Jales W-56]|uniref:hypothetical protein n=1 Tax=Undibacterium sp. Jales W-56 TaxID=2897325 RepID=UPI0021CEC2EB|nr:hypothetical protein [Undibacterium sp. Jales W-56]MCU6433736.1 hypothetical protein [Undibacterium sp. Jales W-56]
MTGPATRQVPRQTQVLFVHGMGRTPLSAFPLLSRLREHGLQTYSFHYFVALENFATIQARLVKQLCAIAAKGEYVLIGHSLGGVLLRAALNALPAGTRQPDQLFLLGSPITASRIAGRIRDLLPFQIISGDCGQLLSSPERMSAIGSVSTPTIAIVGNKGIKGKYSPFGDEDNDGVVSISEAYAAWAEQEILLPVMHTLMPSSRLVSEALIKNLRRTDKGAQRQEA